MEKENVTFQKRDGTLVACLGCEIDHHTARHLRGRIDTELFLHRPKTLVLDFSGVRFMDSSGIALILGRVETAAAVGAVVTLRGLSPTLYKLVRLAGVERVKNLTVIAADNR